jgi:hypothetical protein
MNIILKDKIKKYNFNNQRKRLIRPKKKKKLLKPTSSSLTIKLSPTLGFL